MIKKSFSYLLFLGIFSLFFLFNAQNVSAVTATITGTWDAAISPVNKVCGSGQVAVQTFFSVSFSDGWTASGNFACQAPGCARPTGFQSFTPPASSGCVGVVLQPTNSGAQPAFGTICKNSGMTSVPGDPPACPCCSLPYGLTAVPITEDGRYIKSDGTATFSNILYTQTAGYYKYTDACGSSWWAYGWDKEFCDAMTDVWHSGACNWDAYVWRPDLTKTGRSHFSGKGWKFVGWRTSRTGSYVSTGQYYHQNISIGLYHVMVYAVYKKSDVKLTLKSIDTGGNSLSGLIADKTTTVDEGKTASITAGSTTGYALTGFRDGSNNNVTSTSSSSARYITGGNTYNVKSLRTNENAYAVYKRYDFSGAVNASVVNNDIGNTSVLVAPTSTSSNWAGAAGGNRTAPQLNMECANEGCKVQFDIRLKNLNGVGSTSYIIYQNINSQGDKVVRNSTTFSSTGELSVSAPVVTLYPGQSVCYSIKFFPYGALPNDNERTAKACVYAKPSYFAGRTVATSASDTTSAPPVENTWANSNNAQIHDIDSCTAYGCDIRFQHYLNRTDGIGTTSYQISRTSNYWVSSKSLGVAPNGNLKSGNFRPTINGTQNNTGHLILDTNNYKLVPGMVVCETMTFKPHNNTVSPAGDVYTRVCAYALGNAQPPDPANPDTPNPNKPGGDETISPAFLNIKVKNNSVEKYNKYQTTVMAKPSDVLTFRATYNPILQYTYELVPHKMRTDGGTIFPVSSVNSAYTLEQLYNANKPAGKSNWRNGFSVSSNNFATGSFHQDYNYDIGETALRAQTNNKTVIYQEAGKSISETAKTNMNNNTQTTPSQITFDNIGGNNTADVITAEVTSTANVRVPINYNTRSEVLSQNEYIYPGEQTTIKYEIDVLPKNNSETTNNSTEVYATTAPQVYRKLIIYKPGATSTIKPGVDQWGSSATDNLCSYFGLPNNEYDCGYTDQEIKDLNTEGNPDGFAHDNLDATFNVQDQNAGTRICVAVANYPSNSGPATNYSDYQGSHTWRISDSRCYTVAKKPNIAVWGGNVYSSGKITTFTSVKNNVAGYTAYNLRQANNESYVFGSWTDGGLVSAGVVANSTKDSSGGNVTAGFASGSGTGFATNANGVTWPKYNDNNESSAHPNPDPGPGGSLEKAAEVSICIRSTLTFANHPCNNNIGVGSIGSSIASSNVSDDKSSIVSKLAFGGTPNVSGTVALNDASKIREGDIYYYYGGNNNITIPRSDITTNTLQVVHSNSNVVISGDIKYPSSFTTLEEIPKLVVYGKNIVIDCSVEEVHALLVADEKVITCNNFDGDFEHLEDKARDHINDEVNANQLKITGAIVANKLIPNRTYGNGAGANSIVPAEIIDYDPTLYLWGAKQDPNDSHHEQNETLDATYMHEISPRY